MTKENIFVKCADLTLLGLLLGLIDQLGSRLDLKYSHWDWTLSDPDYK